MPLNISMDRGQPVVDPATLPPGTVVKVYGTVPLPYKRALGALVGSTANVLSLASVAGVVPGMDVAAAGIPGNVTVLSVNAGAKKVVLSAPVTANVPSGASVALSKSVATTAATASGANLAVPTAGLSVGMTISGMNADPSATVQAIVDANNLTMSAPATGTIAKTTFFTFALAGGRTTSAATGPGSTSPLGLQVTTADPDGLLGNGYENVIGAMVYNEKMVSFAKLSDAVGKGWALVPMANIVPAAPTYV